jgi:hypothetical protein
LVRPLTGQHPEDQEDILVRADASVSTLVAQSSYSKGKTCRKHTPHKVTQYKTGKASLYAQGALGFRHRFALDG